MIVCMPFKKNPDTADSVFMILLPFLYCAKFNGSGCYQHGTFERMEAGGGWRGAGLGEKKTDSCIELAVW